MGGHKAAARGELFGSRENGKSKRFRGESMILKSEKEMAETGTGKRRNEEKEMLHRKATSPALKSRSKKSKIIKIVGAIVILLVLVGLFSPSEGQRDRGGAQGEETSQAEATPRPKTAKELMFEKVTELIKSKDAFDTGSYVKGDIPAGEYAFVSFEGSGKYYAEEDSAGNIIDNENFDSFGYVYVHGAGNLKTRGVLIKIDAFDKLGVKSAKEVYEKLNDVSDYKESALYKVGVDIAPGSYAVESYSEGYVAIMSGPVGKSDIVDNEAFKGKHSVNVRAGQYLKVSRAKLP